MEYVLRYVTIGLTIFLIGLIRLGYKSKSVSQDSLIKQPFLYFWSGMFSGLGFALLVIVVPLLPTTSDRETMNSFIIVFSILMIFSMLFVWYYIIWEIKLDKTTFSYRNFFGKVRKYEYIRCTDVTKSARVDIYHDKKCIIRISALSPNWYALSKRLEPNMEVYQKNMNKK
ncbi:MAG: hypothetical protein RBQ97_12215 [Acholeplasma sp.]|nr:hypothetical protein [Acholeplasma sp.]